MGSLTAAIADLDVSEHWNRSIHVQRGAFDVEQQKGELDRVLSSPALHWPYVVLVRSGQRTEDSAYTTQMTTTRARPVRPDDLARLVSEGHTAKVQYLEHWSLEFAACSRLLAERFRAEIVAYAFVTPGRARGLDYHRDDSHVVVAQIDGDKDWSVFRRPDSGTRAPIGSEDEELREDITLHPGDLLYVPHGWTHAARTTTDHASTHVSFTLTEPSPAQVLDRAAGAFVSGLTGGGDEPPLLDDLTTEFLEWLRADPERAAPTDPPASGASPVVPRNDLERWLLTTPLPTWAARVFAGAEDLTGGLTERRLPHHTREAYLDGGRVVQAVRDGAGVWLAAGPLTQALGEDLSLPEASGAVLVVGLEGSRLVGGAPPTGRVRVEPILGQVRGETHRLVRAFDLEATLEGVVLAVHTVQNPTVQDLSRETLAALGLQDEEWYLGDAVTDVRRALRRTP